MPQGTRGERLKELSVLLALLFCCNYSLAEWRRLSGGPPADYTQYIDLDTLKITDDGKIRIWELMDHKNPKPTVSGDLARSAKVYWEIDCQEFKHRVLAGSWFTGQMGNGQSLGSTKASEYSFIQPGSVAAGLATPLCSNTK